MELNEIITEMECFEKEGGMSVHDIRRIRKELEAICEVMINRELREFAQIYLDEMRKRTISDFEFYKYVDANKEAVSNLLNKSVRTIYRKIQDRNFTEDEKKMIREMNKNGKY